MSSNDLFQALEMFNKGATELTASRAIRGAADQAQMINMNEQDEFARRQQLTQLGQGLAMQLSSVGASPTQIQQSVGAFVPQQLNGPADFFAASQQATKPNAKKQLADAGMGMQAQIAAAPMTTAQKAQDRLGWASLMATNSAADKAGRDKLAEEVAKRQVPDFEVMPGIIPQEEDVKKVKASNASRLALIGNINRLESMIKKNGTEAFSITNNDAGDMQSVYKSALSELRTMEELGVLNKEDIPQLEGILQDPTSWSQMFKMNSGEKVLSSYQQFRKTLDDKITARAMARGYVPAANSPLRKNAIKLQRVQNAEKEIGDLQSKLSSVPQNSPEYAAMQAIIQAAQGKANRLASE